MRIIDVHTHVFPDDVAAAAMPALEEEADVKASFDGTLSGLISEMDRAGIHVALTQPVSTKPSQVCPINDWAATTASDRIIPFGGMHPGFDEPWAEIERMAGLGLRGFKMHPEYQAFRPDEDRMSPIFEAATAFGMIILFHSGVDIGIPTLHGTPDAFARALDLHTDATVILAHMGGYRQWDEVRDSLVGREVYFDTSYSLGHMEDEDFVDLVMEHGADRVLFGTDGPWADMRTEVDLIRSVGLAEEDLAAILGGNAARLLQ